MTDIAHVIYLFDPLCGWCYGASPMIGKLAAQPGFTVELAPTGLFSGGGVRTMSDEFAAFAWANDQRIARLTGQPFSEDYRRNILCDRRHAFDSGPATLALTAVALTAPEKAVEALQVIQTARYVEGRDVTDIALLSGLLRSLSLDGAADCLSNLDDALVTACSERLDSARQRMRRFGVSGVPALIADAGKGSNLVAGNMLFGDFEALIAALKGSLSPSAAPHERIDG